jgi:arylsulfatase A-like enzyme
LSYFKTTTYEGGVHVPLIVRGPGVLKRGVDATQLLHVADIVPTVLDFVGAARPERVGDTELAPLYGRSWKAYLTGETQLPIRGAFDALGFEMMECRAIIKNGWKLVFLAPPYGDNDWRLYNLRDDPRELTDLSSAHPQKFEELKSDWASYARSVGYIEAGEIKQLEGMPPEEFFKYTGLV